MNAYGKCYSCKKFTMIHHPFDKDSFICAYHYQKLKKSFPISKIPDIHKLNLPGDGLTDSPEINKIIGKICKSDLSFSEKLTAIEEYL